MQGIGIGVSDFKALRLKDCYFIDKSLFIKHIIDNKSSVTLITRPRRFGKTLNMSMLRYYLDCTRRFTDGLFDELKIMEQGEFYTSKQKAYPVIYMSFKSVKGLNMEEMLATYRIELNELFIDHSYLLKSEKLLDIEKEMFSKVLNMKADKIEIQNALKLLSKLLYKEFDMPVYLIIDEYDVPLQDAYVNGFYEDAIPFFRTLYGTTFKDNMYLEKTVITGVSRVAKESIFSGANNFNIYTVLDDDEFSEDFGITEGELEKIIKDFEVEEDREEIKKWYDGYIIGDTKGLYNPWSILNFLLKKKLMPYWVNTSSNDLIKMILKKSTTIKQKIESLLRDEEIEVTLDSETVIVGIEENEDNIWGLLLGTGYLKVVETVNIAEGLYKVKIPNNEIKELFRNIVRDWFKNKVIGNDLHTILKDLINLNLKDFEKKFKLLTIEMFSFMDVGINTAENFYHAFVLGMLVGLKDTYYVTSNRESGFGRYDIMLESKDKTGNSFIMEFKVLDDMDEKTIEDTIQNAIKQIEERKYEEELKMRGFENITKMVFAFNGKEVQMKVV